MKTRTHPTRPLRRAWVVLLAGLLMAGGATGEEPAPAQIGLEAADGNRAAPGGEPESEVEAGGDPQAAFDQVFAGLEGSDGITGAGRVVGRFAPPVAAVAPDALALDERRRAAGTGIGSIRQPCDAPGAGCRNTPGRLNPTIGSGTRPTPGGPPAN